MTFMNLYFLQLVLASFFFYSSVRVNLYMDFFANSCKMSKRKLAAFINTHRWMDYDLFNETFISPFLDKISREIKMLVIIIFLDIYKGIYLAPFDFSSIHLCWWYCFSLYWTLSKSLSKKNQKSFIDMKLLLKWLKSQ